MWTYPSAVDQYQWDNNPNLMKERPKHNMASHMSDALRYALYTFETSASTFNQTPTKIIVDKKVNFWYNF